jgi:hypothetical protein
MVHQVAIASFVLAIGCGDNVEVEPVDGRPAQLCDRDDWLHQFYGSYQGAYCLNAGLLALRYGGDVVVQQDDIDYFYSLSKRVYVAEPLTRLASAARIWDDLLEVPLYSEYEPLVSAWSAGLVNTGDPIVDHLFADNGMVSVRPWRPPSPDRPPSFSPGFELPVSHEVLTMLVRTIPDTQLVGPSLERSEDITIVRYKDGVLLHMVAGWGDCFSGCASHHRWDAFVTSAGAVTVTDLGGDPIPDWLLQSVASSPDPE